MDGRTPVLSDKEFHQFQALIYRIAGITLSDAKKSLVSGRLMKHVVHRELDSFGAYFQLLMQDKSELQVAVDALTTNETFFFREPKHLEFLRDSILPNVVSTRPFRVWSAASSSGEEAFSIAMILADGLGDRPWEVMGSDISQRMLEKARQGHYSFERVEGIPKTYLKRFCLKGVRSQEGTFMMGDTLRSRVSFRYINLKDTLPQIGIFDVIFIRNVMIYFDLEVKKAVLQRLLPLLRPGGYLFVSHSESLTGFHGPLKAVRPSIYRLPDD
ncbi:SAM-dependent methyltransferase [Halothiobacillus diazotrophicus]|uniref:Chemotaxis protein methyltransferase n=1 Tax=Halothiobacillus diazotrophicus TaxID=1860122 RepID=A0A191ZEP3_9GAMM|nr:protein-glutamate O-methyltransferase CheR [Halothiobacillus diazotrophicus]ANJ66339.1 SAM-dependent methyltransferase [Halothiobacillus diazotrophicus]